MSQTEFVIRWSGNHRQYVMEYPPEHNLHKLVWTWTFDALKATRFPTREAAEARAVGLAIGNCRVEKF